MLRVAVVNRFYPPDPAITGKAAHELVAYLKTHVAGMEIRVFASSARYRGGVNQEEAHHEVERVSGARIRDKGSMRLLASLWEGYQLAKRAVRWADVIISLTDPPLLGLWVGHAIAATSRDVRWIEWTMDVYPEAFVAAGLVEDSNPVYRHVSRHVGRNLPDRYICLGPNQHAAVEHFRGCVRPATILPCGIIDPVRPMAAPPGWRIGERRVILAYAGNLGEAHCAEGLVGLVQHADPARFAFLLSLYGSQAGRIKAALGGRTNIIWRDHVDHSELIYVDVHIATLKGCWAHLCVPSKAVSTVCLGKPILFVGPADADTIGLLGEAAWRLPDSIDGCYDAQCLEPVFTEMADADKRAARELAAERIRARLTNAKEAAFRELGAWLQGSMNGISSVGASAVVVPARAEAVAAK